MKYVLNLNKSNIHYNNYIPRIFVIVHGTRDFRVT